MTADEIIEKLKMQPHPEGGHYAETFRDPRAVEGRSVGTAIFYLLQAGEKSHWHRVDAAEIWHYYVGAPLELGMAEHEKPGTKLILGTDLAKGELPQRVIPAGYWQMARSLGDWTLVGCTVAPGFEFSGFEMAPSGWSPPTQ